MKKGRCISPYTRSNNNIYLRKIQRRSPFVAIIFEGILCFLLFKIPTITRYAVAYSLGPLARFVDSTLLMCDHIAELFMPPLNCSSWQKIRTIHTFHFIQHLLHCETTTDTISDHTTLFNSYIRTLGSHFCNISV